MVGVPVAVGVGVVPPGAQGLGRGCVFSCPCCWPPEAGVEFPAVNQVTCHCCHHPLTLSLSSWFMAEAIRSIMIQYNFI